MAKHYHPKRLLVEGQDDLRVIPELIEKNGIYWGAKKEEAIISIQECGGYENTLYRTKNREKACKGNRERVS